MKAYFERLKDHPGLSHGILISIALIFGGTMNQSFTIWWHGPLFGFLVSLIFPWSIILISNRK